MTSEVKSRKDKRPVGKQGFKSAEFINYALTEADKARLPDFRAKVEADYWGILDKLIGAGYKLSVTHDSYAECEACYLSSSDEKNPNHGFILSGRAHSSEMAVIGCLYRHYIVFEELWPVRETRNVGLDDD